MPQIPYDYWNPPVNSDYSTVVSASYMTERDNEVKAIERTLGKRIVPGTGGDPEIELVARLKVGQGPDYNLILAGDGGKVCVRDEDTRPGVIKGDLDVFVDDDWADATIRVANRARGVIFSAAFGDVPTVASVGNERLQFRAGNSNNADYLFTSSGKMGVGVTDPTAKLDVNSHTIRVRQFTSPPSAYSEGNVGDIRLTATTGPSPVYHLYFLR